MLGSSSPRLSPAEGPFTPCLRYRVYLTVHKELKRFHNTVQDPDGRKIRTGRTDKIAKLTSFKATQSAQIVETGMDGPCCREQVKEEGF